MKDSRLMMPAQYMVMDEEEMVQAVGGGIISNFFFALSKMFNFKHKKASQNNSYSIPPELENVIVPVDAVYGCGLSYDNDYRSKNTLSNFFKGLGTVCRILGY